MFKSFLEIIRQLFGFATDTADNKASIKETEVKIEQALDRMDAMVYGFQRLSENEAHERKKMALRMQLAL